MSNNGNHYGKDDKQGRFRAFPIAEDEHLLTVLRYIERNPLRAGLVKKAEQWRWSSAALWADEAAAPAYLVAGPVERPRPWLKWIDQAVTAAELEALRQCVNRGTPFGNAAWTARIAEVLGIASTLRPRGRPRKTQTAARTPRTKIGQQ